MLHELGEAARILLLEARARRVGREALGIVRHAVLADTLGRRLGILLELLVALAVRPRAHAGQGEGEGAVSVEAAEMRGGESALRQADDMGLGDTEVVQHVPGIVDRRLLAVLGAIGRHVRAGIAAEGVGDAAMPPGEEAHLRFPAPPVATVLVDEQDRRAAAGFLEVELHAVRRRGMRHLYDSWNHRNVVIPSAARDLSRHSNPGGRTMWDWPPLPARPSLSDASP